MGDAAPMVFLDPPEHTRFRALVSKALTPCKVSTIESDVRRFVVERLDRLREMGTADIVDLLIRAIRVIRGSSSIAEQSPYNPAPVHGLRRRRKIMSMFLDTSGGSYFYLDNEDRAVLADAEQRIFRVRFSDR
jgi:hypothetical protein